MHIQLITKAQFYKYSMNIALHWNLCERSFVYNYFLVWESFPFESASVSWTTFCLSFKRFIVVMCIQNRVYVCLQPALTAVVFLVHMVRFGKPRRMPAACTAATMTPSFPWNTTAPAWWRLRAVEQGRWSSVWLMTPAVAHKKSVVSLSAFVWNVQDSLQINNCYSLDLRLFWFMT